MIPLLFLWQGSQAAVASSAGSPGGAGGKSRRRRYLLPDDRLVWATVSEINEILHTHYVKVEPQKPKKKKKQKKVARVDTFEPIEIEFVPLPDFSVKTFKPITSPAFEWRPDLEALKRQIELLKRRIEDEEVILLFL